MQTQTLIGYVEDVVASYAGPPSGFSPKAPLYEVIRAYPFFDAVYALFGGQKSRPIWILRVTERDREPVRYRYPTRWKAEERAARLARGRVGRRKL